MKKRSTSSAKAASRKFREEIAFIATRHGIPEARAARVFDTLVERSRDHHYADGWLLKLLDAQFRTHIGPYRRIRCGHEDHLRHLIPDHGRLCHDCGCARGEYHVFGCDSEECSHCCGQAFCCECDDDTAGEVSEPSSSSPAEHGDAA